MTKRRLTISLDARDHERLTRIAAREDRSLSWLIAVAVKGFLDRAEPQMTIPLEEPEQGRVSRGSSQET